MRVRLEGFGRQDHLGFGSRSKGGRGANEAGKDFSFCSLNYRDQQMTGFQAGPGWGMEMETPWVGLHRWDLVAFSRLNNEGDVLLHMRGWR